MSKTRVTIELREDVRRALAIRAAELNTSIGAVIDSLTLDNLPSLVEQAQRAIDSEDSKPLPKPKGRPPRKPSS